MNVAEFSAAGFSSVFGWLSAPQSDYAGIICINSIEDVHHFAWDDCVFVFVVLS